MRGKLIAALGQLLEGGYPVDLPRCAGAELPMLELFWRALCVRR